MYARGPCLDGRGPPPHTAFKIFKILKMRQIFKILEILWILKICEISNVLKILRILKISEFDHVWAKTAPSMLKSDTATKVDAFAP